MHARFQDELKGTMVSQQLLKRILLEWSKPEAGFGHTPVFWKHRRETQSWRDMLTLPDFSPWELFLKMSLRSGSFNDLETSCKRLCQKYSSLLWLLCILHFLFVVLKAKRLKTGTRVLRLLLAHLRSLSYLCLYSRQRNGMGVGREGCGLTVPSLPQKELPGFFFAPVYKWH